MVNIQILRREALRLRTAMDSCDKDSCDKDSSTILTNSFPIMNCKFASLLLAFHYFQRLNNIEITCVTGYGENMVSHVWLEIEEHVVDITGDQFNLIDHVQLNEKILKYRPFSKIHVTKVTQSYLPIVFKRTERIGLDKDFSDFKASFIDKMKSSYSTLIV